MKEKIKKKLINLLIKEINKYNKLKKDKRGIYNKKYSNKYVLNIIINKFILGMSWNGVKTPLRLNLSFSLGFRRQIDHIKYNDKNLTMLCILDIGN